MNDTASAGAILGVLDQVTELRVAVRPERGVQRDRLAAVLLHLDDLLRGHVEKLPAQDVASLAVRMSTAPVTLSGSEARSSLPTSRWPPVR
jgi:hypothetical protein